MADIRKRTGKRGTSYQVRYPSRSTKSGYAFKSFGTLKEARHFLESGEIQQQADLDTSITEVPEAVDRWLDICETEGTNDREPVTEYTLKIYGYHAGFIKRYPWEKKLQELTTPDIVHFRSWLIKNCPSRYTARKTLTYFHGMMSEMALRGCITYNVANGVSISSQSRYKEPLEIPSHQDILALLAAADRLALSSHPQIAMAWRKYRPLLYLAVDSGMRPQEYLALSHAALRENGVYIDRAIEGSGKAISVTKTQAGRRMIELSPKTMLLIRDYAENYSEKNDYDLVFPTESGTWQCKRNWRNRAFAPACIEAGLYTEEEKDGKPFKKVKFKPYALRHYFASVLIENHTNPKRLQKLMGHEDVKLTFSTYGHLIEVAEETENGHAGILHQIPCGKSVARVLHAAE